MLAAVDVWVSEEDDVLLREVTRWATDAEATAFVEHAVVVGVEAGRRRWDASTAMGGMGYREQPTIPDVKTDTIGLFAEGSRELGSDLLLTVGGRLDYLVAEADASIAAVAGSTFASAFAPASLAVAFAWGAASFAAVGAARSALRRRYRS